MWSRSGLLSTSASHEAEKVSEVELPISQPCRRAKHLIPKQE